MQAKRGRPRRGVDAVDAPLRLEFEALSLLLSFLTHKRPADDLQEYLRTNLASLLAGEYHPSTLELKVQWSADVRPDGNGEDLRHLPLVKWKRRLLSILPAVESRLLYLDHICGTRLRSIPRCV